MIRDRKIFWIGGSPCSGKSTISELLMNEYGFKLYRCDDHLERYMKLGAEKGSAIMQKIISMNLDETWLRNVEELVEDEFKFYREALEVIMRDVEEISKSTSVIVEGAAILPEFITSRNIDKDRYVCIVPTKEFQIENYSKREWVSHYLSGCSDSDKAFTNWMERDAKYADLVIEQSRNKDLNYLIVDGSKSIEENYVIVKKLFDLDKIPSTKIL